MHFGSRNELYPLDFSSPEMYTTERIFDAIEVFFGSGTDFESPLTAGVERLRAEYTSTGRVSGDIVMVTDGICGVRPQWLSWFKEEAATLGFSTWGINVGYAQNPKLEPLHEICNGQVFTVRDFAGGGDVRQIFQRI